MAVDFNRVSLREECAAAMGRKTDHGPSLSCPPSHRRYSPCPHAPFRTVIPWHAASNNDTTSLTWKAGSNSSGEAKLETSCSAAIRTSAMCVCVCVRVCVLWFWRIHCWAVTGVVTSAPASS